MAPAASPIHILAGGDSVQQNKAILAIQNKHYGQQEVELRRFDASAGGIPPAIDEILSYSLLNPDQIVILERFEKVPKADMNLLLDYAKNPRGDTPFILIFSSSKEIPKNLEKCVNPSCIKTLSKTGKSEIRKMILQKCAADHIQFEDDALQFFMQNCSESIEMAIQELEKLLLWADEGGSISLDLCHRLLQTEKEKNIWAITNAVGERKVENALQAIDLLLSQGEGEVDITRMLIWELKTLYHCKSLLEEKTDTSELSRRLGRRGYGLQKTQQRCKAFSLYSLQQAIGALRNLDNQLKGGISVSSPAQRRFLLERLVIDLCQF